jgi:hypothetical protein|tara:strand:+ start:2150 stop:2524 length:375 start_codon:yes stop_codon:yes gene_type:complete
MVSLTLAEQYDNKSWERPTTWKIGSLYEFDYDFPKTGPATRKVLITEIGPGYIHGWDFYAKNEPYWRNFHTCWAKNVTCHDNIVRKVPKEQVSNTNSVLDFYKEKGYPAFAAENGDVYAVGIHV